jgi:chromosome segregation ATPase
VLSSKNNEEKFEARFLTRLDVLSERVDTLASTVANTSSGLAKKDGEIAALQRALEARDQTLKALVEHANRVAQAPAADVPVDASELRSLRNAVAALTKERADGVNAAQIRGLVGTVRALAERVDALTAAADAPTPPDPAMTARIDAVAAEVKVVKTALESPPEELVAMLSTLRQRVDGLEELERGVTEEQLEHRVAATNDALAMLRQRLEALAETHEENERNRAADGSQLDRRFTETGDALAGVSHRLEAIAGELERTHAVNEEALDRRFTETEDKLTELVRRLDGLPSVDEHALDRRFEAQDNAFTKLARRLDALAQTVESAASGLGEKEHELASLQRHFTESSTRIESIVDDIREALHAFPELGATSMDDLASRLERLETAARKANETGARAAGELSGRIDVIDQRLATVADEVSRAKTLWPVALRSLEARLEDAAHARRPELPLVATAPESGSAEVPDDLLTGLRDSLQAMESVAAEMARASETLTGVASTDDAAAEEISEEEAPSEHPPSDEGAAEPIPAEQVEEPRAAAGGATIVPLRAGEP